MDRTFMRGAAFNPSGTAATCQVCLIEKTLYINIPMKDVRQA
jgi:hypothetical protein